MHLVLQSNRFPRLAVNRFEMRYKKVAKAK